MQRISCKTASLAVVLTLTLIGSVQAQQHQQHHPGAARTSQRQPAETGKETAVQPQMMEHMQGMIEHMQGMMERMQSMMRDDDMKGRQGMRGRRGMERMAQEEDDDEEDSPQHGMRGRRGEMRGMGSTIQHHLERLAQRLELTEEQRTQMWPLLSTHAKEAIHLKADIETLGIDLRQLLEAEPVDLPQVKQVLQTRAGKEAELRYVHITAMQEIGKILTPEQRQKLRTMRRSMMGHGGMMSHGGMKGRGQREK